MTSTGEDIGGDRNPYYAGDSLEMEFSVITPDGTAKDLSNATIEWTISDDEGDPELLSEDDPGVTTTILNASDGVFEVVIDSETTTGMEGTYYHEARVTDDAGDTAVVSRGTVEIEARVTQ